MCNDDSIEVMKILSKNIEKLMIVMKSLQLDIRSLDQEIAGFTRDGE